MRFGRELREKHGRGKSTAGACRANVLRAALALVLALFSSHALFAGGPAAQKQKNKKHEPDTTGIVSPIPPPDAQAIDVLVSQMLAAWQVGDADMMHKYYADDVTTVSGAWAPPLLGWDTYVHAYEAQRARTQGNRLERTNTYTKVTGDTAWCTYQWQYTGEVDGTPAAAFGHTTLVLEKRADKWLIVFNHTSVVPVPAQQSPATAVPQSARPATQAPSGPGA